MTDRKLFIYHLLYGQFLGLGVFCFSSFSFGLGSVELRYLEFTRHKSRINGYFGLSQMSALFMFTGL